MVGAQLWYWQLTSIDTTGGIGLIGQLACTPAFNPLAGCFGQAIQLPTARSTNPMSTPTPSPSCLLTAFQLSPMRPALPTSEERLL